MNSMGFTQTGHKPWPIDGRFIQPLALEKWGNRTAVEILNIWRQAGQLIYESLERKEPWPVDPNAPKNTIQEWVNNGYKVVFIGSGNVGRHYIPDVTPFSLEIPTGLESSMKINAEAIKEISELKHQISEKMFDNSNKVTPREQRNRERFNKRRR